MKSSTIHKPTMQDYIPVKLKYPKIEFILSDYLDHLSMNEWQQLYIHKHCGVIHC